MAYYLVKESDFRSASPTKQFTVFHGVKIDIVYTTEEMDFPILDIDNIPADLSFNKNYLMEAIND